MSWLRSNVKFDSADSRAGQRSAGAEFGADRSGSGVVIHDESRYGTVRTGRVNEGCRIATSTQSAWAWQWGQHRGSPAGGSAVGADSIGVAGSGEVVGAGGNAARATAIRAWRWRLARRP